MSKRSIVKDWITDGTAVIIWGVAIYLLYCGELEFWPGFCGMLVAGGIMFYVPDDWVTTKLKQWLKQKFGVK